MNVNLLNKKDKKNQLNSKDNANFNWTWILAEHQSQSRRELNIIYGSKAKTFQMKTEQEFDMDSIIKHFRCELNMNSGSKAKRI